MTPSRPYPGIGHAVLMSVAMLVLQGVFVTPVVIFEMISSGWSPDKTSAIHLSPTVVGVVNVLAISCIIWWGYAANNVSLRTLLPVTRVSALACAAVVIAGLGLVVVLSEADNMLRAILPMPDWFLESMGDTMAFETHPWATVILLTAVAPLTEEPFFRGVILRGLLGRNTPRVAIVVSALLFGFVHLNPWQFVGASLLGIVFGWYFLRTRSLVPCIIGHAVSNGVVAFAGLVAFEMPGFSGRDISIEAHQPWWFTGGGAVLAAIGLWLFARATKASVPPPMPVVSDAARLAVVANVSVVASDSPPPAS